MFKVFNGVIEDAEYLMNAAIIVMATWFVVWTWFRTKALVPTLGALLLGAVVIFGVSGFDTTLKNRIDEDVDRYSEEPDPRQGGRAGG